MDTLYIGDLCILISLLMAQRVFRVPQQILSEPKIDNKSYADERQPTTPGRQAHTKHIKRLNK